MRRIRKAITVTQAGAFAIRSGMREHPISFVDIGGRWGLAKPWHYLSRLGVIAPVFFEPEPIAAEAILAKTPSAKVIQKGVWSTETRKMLYVTADPGGSSVLEPAPECRVPETVKQCTRTDYTIPIDLVRAENELNTLGIKPEIIKIDIQGGELEALKGFGRLLSGVYCVELETMFMRVYRDHPLFNSIYDFMVDAGFGLFDMKVFGVANTRNGISANAFFCRRNAVSERQKNVESIFMKVNDFRYWP